MNIPYERTTWSVKELYEQLTEEQRDYILVDYYCDNIVEIIISNKEKIIKVI